MIGFFKRLRVQLLAEGRLSRYLVYAIGEIVLVVIGILIALQLNNWNEDRKNELAGTGYMASFYEDLKKDTALYAEMLNEYKIKVEQLGVLHACYDTIIRELPCNHCLSTLYLASQAFWELANHNGTIQQLKEAGGMKTIKSQDLEKILQYDNILVTYKLDEKTVFQETQTMLRNVSSKLIDFGALVESPPFRTRAINVQSMGHLNEYFNILKRYTTYCEFALNGLETLDVEARQTLAYLQNEYGFE